MIQNKPKILQQMLKDMATVPEIYVPTNYWANYQRQSCDLIAAQGITRFRASENAVWSSFGAVADPLLGIARKQNRNVGAPASRSIPVPRKIQRSFRAVVSKLPLLRKWLTNQQLFYKLLTAYEDHLRMLLELSYSYCYLVDDTRLISRISDSGLGNPNIIFSLNGHNYTLHFLRAFLQYLYLARWIDFNQVQGILEIGGGYGALAEVIMQCHPKIVYVNIDIPPQAYIAQQYLDACFVGKVSGYMEARDKIVTSGEFNPWKHPERKIFNLCTWQLPFLKGGYDLFINSASFQEMEPRVVANYASQLRRMVRKYGYIRAMPDGVTVAARPRGGGVLEKTTRQHYLDYFDWMKLLNESAAAVLPALPGTFDLYRDMLFERHSQISVVTESSSPQSSRLPEQQ